MQHEDAKRRIEDLSTEFDAKFSSGIMEESHERETWMEKAGRLASDLFGPHETLYTEIAELRKLSSAYESGRHATEKSRIAKEWHRKGKAWLTRMSENVLASEDKKIYQTAWFAFAYPVFAAMIPVGLSLWLTFQHDENRQDLEQKFVKQEIEESRKRELSVVMAEFGIWVNGAHRGEADSLEAIASEFASRGVLNSGLYVEAVYRWALRTRSSLDSTRILYFARIAALGGDTLDLAAPRKLGVRVDKDMGLRIGNLRSDFSYMRLDTL